MTKAELVLALQRFPDETPILIGELECVRVEMHLDHTPTVVDAKADTWQAMLASRLKLVLIAGLKHQALEQVAPAIKGLKS